MIDFVAIGRRIKAHRKKIGMTQATLSEELGVSTSYVSQIECGTAEVSLKRLDEIAQLIDTKIEYLIADSNDSVPSFSHSEIADLINDWTPAQKVSLINILNEINSTLRNNR